MPREYRSEAGQTLSNSMFTCRGAFSDFHLGLIKVSEGSGTLDSTLSHLAEHEEKLRQTGFPTRQSGAAIHVNFCSVE